MSCENDNIEYWRLTQKYSTIPGVTPTIPPSQNHTDGTWSDTDLYIGEFFMNVSDNLLWYRTIDGIHLVTGATGASGSFVGDYVPTSGGTYSGGVFAPTFSSYAITAALITASAFNGQVFGSSGSTYYGDGSHLTGIVANWNGGTVSNPAAFENNVVLDSTVVINGAISTANDCIDFQSDICVAGGVSASFFVGDGSGLTGIVATYSDNFTTDAYLQGSSIYFDRTDGTASYFVDLSPILATYSILTTSWDPNTSEFQIVTNGGDTFTETINEFASLNVQTSVTANDFYGGTFNGTFNGTFSGTISGDIYTTSANLSGTTVEFLRTNGTTYSVDLSSLSGAGGTQSLAQTLAVGNTLGGNSISSEDGQSLLFVPGGQDGFWITSEDPGALYTDVRFEKYNGAYMAHDDLVAGNGGAFYVTKDNIQTNSYLPTGEASTQNIEATHINQTVNSGSASTGSSTFDIRQYEIEAKTIVTDPGLGSLSANQRTYQSSGVAVSEMTTSNVSQGMVASIYNTFDPGNFRVENILQVNSPNPYGSPYVTTITQRGDEIKVAGNAGSFRGIEYDADYSAEFTANSLVTKDWVVNNQAQSLTDTVGTRTDEIFVDASGSYPTPTYTTIRSYNTAYGSTGSIKVDPDSINLYVGQNVGSYESNISINQEILTIYGGRPDENNQTTWGLELGTEVRRYRYVDPVSPWGDPDKFEEKRYVIHKKFTNSSGTPGQEDLYYEDFVQDAINDFEIDFYIMNSESYTPQKKYMTKSYKRRVYYDNYNQATILIPDETKQGDTLDPAYNSWSITTQSSIYGTKYVLDHTLDGSYDYSVTIVVRQTAKKY